MSQLALPPPDGNDDHDRGRSSARDRGAPPASPANGSAGGGSRCHNAESRARGRRPSGTGPFTLEEIQRRLESLIGMVAAGWITPTQANSISRIFHMLIQSLERSDPRRASSGVPQEILADLARRDPAILNILAEFLTAEQFDAVVGEHLANEPIPDEQDPDQPVPEEPVSDEPTPGE